LAADGGDVDDPASLAWGKSLLLHHLGYGVLHSEKDATIIKCVVIVRNCVVEVRVGIFIIVLSRAAAGS
jgi:hypothetical protein